MGRSSQAGKAETREKLLVAAGRGFRLHGFGGIGVDGVAKAAGVTSGAFYAHFGSKAAIFDEALSLGLDDLRNGIAMFRAERGAGWLRPFVLWYLSEPRRADLAGACALPALSLEAARADAPTREVYTARLHSVVTELAAGLPSAAPEKDAWAILALLAGGMTMAHALADSEAGSRIAEATTDAILAIGAPPCRQT